MDLSKRGVLSSKKKVSSRGLELKDYIVSVQRVYRAQKGGRISSFSAVVVVGDSKGVVGYGLGKSKENQDAILKATESAKKNLYRVSLNHSTIPHEQKVKFGGSSLMIKPASPGTGLIAGSAVRIVLEAAGVKDVLSKSFGSSNPHNLVKGTLAALLSLRGASEVARQRGISLSKLFDTEEN